MIPDWFGLVKKWSLMFLFLITPMVYGGFTLDSNEFPIGMYSVDNEKAMIDVSKMGIKYIHTYANGYYDNSEKMKKNLEYLDNAHKYGLKVAFSLSCDHLVKSKDGIGNFIKLVNAVKDHPALGFWYLCDEPDGHGIPVEDILPYYDVLKEITPNIPVAMASAWTENWSKHNSALDFLMIDTYPVHDRDFPNCSLQHMTEFTDNALRLGKPVMPINQCFNWKYLAPEGAEMFRDRPVAKMRYPNTQELRYFCYSGLAQGVRGMFWWSHTRSIMGGKKWLSDVFCDVNTEFSDFVDLVSPAHKPYIFERARDDNLLMAFWSRPSGDWMVLVNAWPLERDICRSTGGKIENAELVPWGGTRKTIARLIDGKVIVSAQPWEVFVWKVEIK